MTLRLLSLSEIKQCISMNQAIEAMESAFTQLAQQQVKLPLRTGVVVDEEKGLTLTMPAYLIKDKTLGLKVVSIFPNNPVKNLPSITGFIMLLDASTGEPKVLMDAAYLTSLRTGAVSGLATKYFAREDAEHVAIIGSGTQAMTQLEAVAAVRNIKRVSIWSRHKKNSEAFSQKIAHLFNTEVCDTVTEAVNGADVICTATSSTEAFIHLKDIKSDVHINAIGSHSRSMQEISQDVLSHAVVFADQLEAVRSESGEIIRAMEQNTLKKESIIELGQWLLSKDVDYKDYLTVFKSVGLAIQDLSVAEVVYQNALKNNLGINFPLNI